MKKSDFVYLQGKASWAKLVTPDLEYRNWQVKLHLTEESQTIWQTLKAGKDGVEGILNDSKMDDDGMFVMLKRPMTKNFGRGDEQLTPPEIVDADGNPLKGVFIGNGSDITCKLEYYTYPIKFKKGVRGSAIRLQSVRVDNLIPYSGKDYTEVEENAVKGLSDQKPQTPSF